MFIFSKLHFYEGTNSHPTNHQKTTTSFNENCKVHFLSVLLSVSQIFNILRGRLRRNLSLEHVEHVYRKIYFWFKYYFRYIFFFARNNQLNGGEI